MKPGRMVASPRSTTRAPAGAAADPTDTMRSPRTTRVARSLSAVPVESNRWAAFRTMVSGACAASADCAAGDAPGSRPAAMASSAAGCRFVPEVALLAVVMAASVSMAVAQSRVTVGAGQFPAHARLPAGASRRVCRRKARKRGESILIRGVRQRPERAQRLLQLRLREARGVVEGAGRFDRRHHRFELLEPALLDRAADGRALCFAAALQRVDQRQGRFAFGQVVTEVLAALLRVGAVVEHVIDQLVRGAEVAAKP